MADMPLVSVHSLPGRAPNNAKLYLFWPAGGAFLWALSSVSKQNVTADQFFYASVLLAISIQAYCSWKRSPDTKVPIWAFVCAAHFVYYGQAIFMAARTSPSSFDRGRSLSDPLLSSAMLVGIIGVLAMGAGRILARILANKKGFVLSLLENFDSTPVRIKALLLVGIAANLLGVPFYGSVIWNISVIIFSVLPLAAFLWLVLVRSFRKLSGFDYLLAMVFLGTRVISGARFNASLGTIVYPLFLMGVADVSVRRKFRWPLIMATACVILFLQPGKTRIRREMSRGEIGGTADAVVKWVQVSASVWDEVLEGRSSLQDQLSATSSRSSLLTMTGLILERTPESVPYQLGTYYPLLLKNLIPRVLWPEKPSVNFANQFFQVEYGLTAKQDIKSVSIACGFEAEGYMNFGWPGIVAIGLLVGFVLGNYELAFFSDCNPTVIAVGLILLPGFLTIESQLVQYLGGILQLAVAAALVFYQMKAKASLSCVNTAESNCVSQKLTA